jgi:hypothetical protein
MLLFLLNSGLGGAILSYSDLGSHSIIFQATKGTIKLFSK